MIVHEEAPQVASEVPSTPTCCHYWIIETAHGPISRGECQVCHEVRDFKNSVFDMERESRDSRSKKGTQPDENNQQPAMSQAPPEVGQEISKELSQELGVEELDVAVDETLNGGESETPEVELEAKLEAESEEAETVIEEPEFAGISED